jgi:hypothetical protein
LFATGTKGHGGLLIRGINISPAASLLRAPVLAPAQRRAPLYLIWFLLNLSATFILFKVFNFCFGKSMSMYNKT